MKKLVTVLFITGIVGMGGHVFADVPNGINYQGLLSENGVAVNGTKRIVFRMFDAETGGVSLLSAGTFELQADVIDGVFNVELGPFTPADIDQFRSNETVYLELEVDGQTFPRQQMLSVGFAFRAQTAASVDPNAVTSAMIQNGAVQNVDIAPQAVEMQHLSAEVLAGMGTVDTSKIQDGAVTAAKINDELKTGEDVGYGLIPQGGIIMWAGSAFDVPPGWTLCDGRDNEGNPDPRIPNLTDRFIVGAAGPHGGAYPVADTGGRNSITLSVNNLPAHAHSVSGNTGSQSHNHTHSGSTSTDGSHTHTIRIHDGQRNGGGTSGTMLMDGAYPTSSAGAHSHTFATGNNSVNHTHAISFTSGSTGSGTSIEIIPLYYALAFIMKL